MQVNNWKFGAQLYDAFSVFLTVSPDVIFGNVYGSISL